MNSYPPSVAVFIGALRQSDIPFKEVYLYGSYARSEAHEWSDIDLGVVTEPFALDSIEETIQLQHLAHQIDPALSPVSIHENDLANRFCSLGQAIKEEGKPLLGKTSKLWGEGRALRPRAQGREVRGILSQIITFILIFFLSREKG